MSLEFDGEDWAVGFAILIGNDWLVSEGAKLNLDFPGSNFAPKLTCSFSALSYPTPGTATNRKLNRKKSCYTCYLQPSWVRSLL
jgi:hypothetical protein